MVAMRPCGTARQRPRAGSLQAVAGREVGAEGRSSPKSVVVYALKPACLPAGQAGRTGRPARLPS